MGEWSVVEEPKKPAASEWSVVPAGSDLPVERPESPPAAPASFGDELTAHLKALAIGIKDSALRANGAATRAIFHPIDTFGGGKAGAVVREGMRGINSNIPFANDAVEAIGGPPAASPADAAAAPGFSDLGGFAGTPVAGMVGGIGARAVEKAVPALARAAGAFTKGAAEERQVTRAVEDLGEKTTKRTRAGVNSDAVTTLVKDNPELRAAAGNDTKVAATIDKAKKGAQAELSSIYQSAPQELSPSNALANMDARIGELSKGTSEEREVARGLKSIRDEFHGAHGEKTGITPQEMRAEQSAYQKKGYGKAMPGDEAASARIAANREASKAVGDAVVRHVTGMDYAEAKAAAADDPAGIAARLFKANDTVNAVNKLEAGVTERAARLQPKEGVVGKAQAVGHAISHPGSLVPAAVDKTVRAADAGIARFGPGPDGMLARFVQAAQQGNPFAQRQLRVLAATPAGAARISAIQAQMQAAPQ